MTVIFVLYGVAGGLGAAIITDFIQGVLTIVFSFLLLPLIMNAVGGMDGIRAGIDDPGKLSLVAPAEIGVFYITVIAINALVGIVTQPHTLSNCAAGKTEYEGRFGWMFGNLLKRVCTIPWCLTGLAGIVYFAAAGRQVEPDHVFGAVAGDFLPEILPGMLGIFIAALLASVMSSCDAFMIASSRALYREHLPPTGRGKEARPLRHRGQNRRRRCRLRRRLFGLQPERRRRRPRSLLEDLRDDGDCLLAGALLETNHGRRRLGRDARRLRRHAADRQDLVRPLVVWDFNASLAQHLPEFMLFEGKLYLPWQMTLYLSTGLIAGIVVSLFTKPVDEKKLDHFYALIRTPDHTGRASRQAVHTARRCRRPGKAAVAAQHGLRIPRPVEDLRRRLPPRLGLCRGIDLRCLFHRQTNAWTSGTVNGAHSRIRVTSAIRWWNRSSTAGPIARTTTALYRCRARIPLKSVPAELGTLARPWKNAAGL